MLVPAFLLNSPAEFPCRTLLPKLSAELSAEPLLHSLPKLSAELPRRTFLPSSGRTYLPDLSIEG
jgi:hypothetical protein